MTDRHSAYIVVLKDDIREDDSRKIIDALSMINGVISVEPVVTTYDTHIGIERAQQRILRRFSDLILEIDKEI